MTRPHRATPEQVVNVLRESHPRARVRKALGDSAELAAEIEANAKRDAKRDESNEGKDGERG